jgi:hypothetical protein
MDYVIIGAMTVGFVNVITFFKPDLDSRIKIAIGVVFAFAWSYVPVEIANDLLGRLKMAFEIGLSSSGVYKLLTKAGGK